MNWIDTLWAGSGGILANARLQASRIVVAVDSGILQLCQGCWMQNVWNENREAA